MYLLKDPRRQRISKGSGFLYARTKSMPLPTTELDAAKNVLRRQGRIVFDAEVTNGIEGRGYVRVDHHLCTPAQVIARAKEEGI